MPCLNPDGTLSPTARRILGALPETASPEAVSAEVLALETGLPLFRVRASVREALNGGLVVEQAGLLRRTALADDLLAKSEVAAER